MPSTRTRCLPAKQLLSHGESTNTKPDTVRGMRSTVDFTINGQPYTVSGDIPGSTSLNVFIREHAKLRGTKAMCHEGGCGACIVAVEVNGEVMAVNSCLVPVLICNGWSIKTIEGIGNRKQGYHLIQATLAEKNGSQCGYCSPGMVMNLYSLLQGKQLTMKEIENSFGSNICRCTGYRPILEAFKSFGVDADPKMRKDIQDIEELYKTKLCKKTGMPCSGRCNGAKVDEIIDMELEGATFHKVLTVAELFEVFARYPEETYVLNGGNTAHGVYRLTPPQVYIDINSIPDLRRIEKNNDGLVLGGGVSLTLAMETFNQHSKDTGFEYLRHLAKHIDLIASVPVRNIGTIAGNLMIKHQHREFPSDLFLILETAGAQIHILEDPGKKSSMCLLEFLEADMKRKLLYSVTLPTRSSEYVFRSFKIMPRAQNAHAHVNAGFLLKLDGSGKVLEKPNIIIGGINEHFLHATRTEEYLLNKSVHDKNVVKTAIETLDGELKPDHVLPDHSPEFRKVLAEGLLYKMLLSIKPENVDPKLRSGGWILERELSSAKQDFDVDRNVWPLNKPMPKIESIYQTSGEGEYINDLPPFPGQVFCAFVHTEVANGKIGDIDSTEALKMKGVVAFYTAKDIPGKNVFVAAESKLLAMIADELLFVDKEILHAGQPIGVIAANTQEIANEAAKRVKVTYIDALKVKPVLSCEDAVLAKDETRFMQTAEKHSKTKGDNTKHVVKGVFQCGSQYHYTMETQTCVCVPTEDGMDVYSATQWMDLTQTGIAECLGVPNNSINIRVRRLGGAYGCKISRSGQVACACALVCHKLNRPARFVMTIESNMQTIGKRNANRQEYELGVDDDGRIQYLNSTHWSNAGCNMNEVSSPYAAEHMYSCYDGSTWNVKSFEARTDIASTTYCRAPGSTEGIAMAEHMMEHIARVVGKDASKVREINMNDEDKANLLPMIEELSKNADFENRKMAVETFNNENRWKKKGIAMVPIKYPLLLWGQFNAHVAIYARDGTVAVTHGGIECGQGIHTKVMQVAAHTLGIDMSLITVKPSDNFTSPNGTMTGGSMTSESVGYATLMACKELLKRLEPVRQELGNPTWQELIMAAHTKDVDLSARYMSKTRDFPESYSIYGVTIGEVEVDMLTGQHLIHRVDLMEDAGRSMNPEVDVGQVEGAFIMGIGFWTSEELIYDPNTGRLTNDRSWNYKPPGAKDIPVDFRVYFRRNAPNMAHILRAKATGEPPLCMSVVLAFAIRNALNAARKDAGNTDAWYQLDGPITTESILLNSLTRKDQMLL